MPSRRESIELDLSQYSEAVRRELYVRIEANELLGSGVSDDDPREPYTAAEAHLQVHYLAGRWLVQWRRLEVPESAPESLQMELLRVRAAAEDPRGYMLSEC
jgi:hypothetical protein